MIMFLKTFAPVLILLNLLCTIIFASLIYRERSLVGYENRLQAEASTDPLTRVLNRRSAIRAYGDVERDRPPKRGISMTCIDVDKFKTINDEHGHLAGDHVLREVADRIGTCIRPTDIYCRMSGDEFLFVLINITSDEARQVTERCRSLISRVPISYSNTAIDVSISLGTVWSARPLPFEDFRSSADNALYRAKDSGRDQVSFGIQHTGQKIA